MIIRGATLSSRLAVVFAFLFALTACGGGGGGGGGFISETATLKMTLLDASGEKTNTITTSSPGTLQIKVGSQRNIVVSASANIGTLFPSSGTALTDNNGVATFQLEAGTSKGAGTVTASASTENGTVTGELPFQVGESGLRLGYFDGDGSFLENQIKIEPNSTLAAGGNAQLSVVILGSDGNRVTTVEEVRFNSGCISAGQALINPTNPASSVNGEASTLYTAAGCSGVDEITASLVGASAQAFGSMNVSAPTTNAVTFESAEPSLIVLKGTGGTNRSETADVVFKVVDGSGLPLQGVPVDFSLTTFAGGLTLSTDSTLSGGDGLVSVTVRAGDVATVVRVVATVDDGKGAPVSTVSDLLTVTTGLPDQNSMSLAVGECGGQGTFVVDAAFNVDGLCRTLTVSMADKFNNPVVDGTAAVFTTELGAIVGSCNTTAGICSVEWRSQEPRLPTLTNDDFVIDIRFSNPAYNCDAHNASSGACPHDLGYVRGGRSTILVHAIGEESFIDRNGNGVMDQDEQDLFANLPEAFIDHNEDGVYTPADPECLGAPQGSRRCIAGQEELFVDFNSNDAFDLNDEPAVYNGLLCPPKGDGIWCSRDLVHVRASNVVTMGNGPNWIFTLLRGRSIVNSVTSGTVHELLIADNLNNPPPGGATVSITGSGNCKVESGSSYEVPNYSGGNLAFSAPFTTSRDAEKPDEAGSVTATLTTPLTSASVTYPCSFSSGECSVITGDDPAFSPRPAEC